MRETIPEFSTSTPCSITHAKCKEPRYHSKEKSGDAFIFKEKFTKMKSLQDLKQSWSVLTFIPKYYNQSFKTVNKKSTHNLVVIFLDRCSRGKPLKFLDVLDLHSWIQSFWASFSTIQNGMASIQLELIIYSIKSLRSIFITTIHYPSVPNTGKRTSV